MAKIRQELSESEPGSESDEDGFKMNFGPRKTAKSEKKEQGIVGLKFMQRAEQKQKEALKAEADLAIA